MEEYNLFRADLIENEIYVCSNETILKWGKNDSTNSINESGEYWNRPGFYNSDFKFKLATTKQKHWLNECIKLVKYISFEEAMKTFQSKSLLESRTVGLLKGLTLLFL